MFEQTIARVETLVKGAVFDCLSAIAGEARGLESMNVIMTLSHLNLIGERINPGFTSSKALLDTEDFKSLQELAVSQVQKGARCLTINLGDKATRDSSFLVKLIEAVQAVVDVPLSFDCPHRLVQEICLKTYRPEKARGRKPIVNSVTELRMDKIAEVDLDPVSAV